MKLPIPFFNKKKENADYYLALILDDEKASAVILHTENGTIKTVNTHEEFFVHTLEDLSLEELINTIDRTVSKAEDVLSPNIQTHNTVFGLKESWVDKETKKITKDNLDKLKKVCNSLDLSPIGFMVTTEAVAHLIQDEEGAPLSAIFAEVTKSRVTLSLMRGGKVIESISHPHLESAPATADKLLSHFTIPVLPARIVLYQSKPDEHTSHAFSTHHWSKNLPFLHVPQVTVLPKKFDTRAVMYGAATQMGLKVLDAEQDALAKSHPKNEEEALTAAGLPQAHDSTENDTHAPDIIPTQSVAPTTEADFGFVVDQDIDTRRNQDEQRDQPLAAAHGLSREPTEHHNNTATDSASQKNILSALPAKIKALPFVKNLKMPPTEKLTSFFKGKKTPIKIIIPLVALLILIIGTVLFYNYSMKATIVLTFAPDIVDQEETVTFSTTGPSDFSENIIAAEEITAAIDTQASTKATGKKEIGKEASGTVTFYNNSDASVTLSSGTQITAANDQVFILDEEVKIASQSGDDFTGTEPGTAEGSVTAKEIGSDGNVPSGTRFTVGSTSTLAARNDNAFSGGDSEEVTVVSEEDLAKLRTDIIKNAQSKGKSELAKQADDGLVILPLISGTALEKPQYNNDVDEEADKVTLKAIVVFSGIAYNEADLEEYAQAILKGQYDQESNFAEDSIKHAIEDAELIEDDNAEATVKLQAGLLPTIDKEEIIETIEGKSLGEARTMVRSLPQVIQADIKFSPPIPLLPNLFPSLPKQLEVEINTE